VDNIYDPSLRRPFSATGVHDLINKYIIPVRKPEAENAR